MGNRTSNDRGKNSVKFRLSLLAVVVLVLLAATNALAQEFPLYLPYIDVGKAITVTPPPIVTATATERPGTIPVAPTPVLVDVPFVDFSNAAVGGVWVHIAVCNHTGENANAVVLLDAVLENGSKESRQWPVVLTVESSECLHAYEIVPFSSAVAKLKAQVID